LREASEWGRGMLKIAFSFTEGADVTKWSWHQAGDLRVIAQNPAPPGNQILWAA